MLTYKGEEDWSPFWLNVFISVPLLRLTALPSSKLNWVIIWIFYYTDLMCFNQLILERGLRLVAIKICQATIWKDALKTHRATDESRLRHQIQPGWAQQKLQAALDRLSCEYAWGYFTSELLNCKVHSDGAPSTEMTLPTVKVSFTQPLIFIFNVFLRLIVKVFLKFTFISENDASHILKPWTWRQNTAVYCASSHARTHTPALWSAVNIHIHAECDYD